MSQLFTITFQETVLLQNASREEAVAWLRRDEIHPDGYTVAQGNTSLTNVNGQTFLYRHDDKGKELPMCATFTKGELDAMCDCPEVIRAVADINGCWETQAAGMDYDESAEHHKNRRIELDALAQRIEDSY